MKIIKKDQAIHAKKPEGIEVWYYLFPEYEIHYNEQPAHTTQVWHFHNKIHETLFIIDGELEVRWKEDGTTRSQILKTGDLVETEKSDHTFENQSDEIVKFFALKQVLSGEDKSDIFKNDKFTSK